MFDKAINFVSSIKGISVSLFLILLVLSLQLFLGKWRVNSTIYQTKHQIDDAFISKTQSNALISKYLNYTVITETPIPTTTRTPTATPTITATPKPTQVSIPELEPLFTVYSDNYSVDKELLKRIARCESGFNSQAINGPYVGLFQFSSSAWITTRTFMNKDPNPVLRLNAEESIKTAAFLLSINGAAAWPNCAN